MLEKIWLDANQPSQQCNTAVTYTFKLLTI